MPNIIVQPVGYMHGHISLSGPICPTPSMPAVLNEDEPALVQIDLKRIIIFQNHNSFCKFGVL